MDVNEIRQALLWCVVLNYAILFVWFGVFMLAHDGIYQLHSRWFKLPVERFDAIQYAGMTVYKIGIILLNLVPLLALYLLTS